MGWGVEPSRGNGVLSQVSHKQEETGWIVLIRINSYSGGTQYRWGGGSFRLCSFHPSPYPPSPIHPSIHPSINLCTSSIYLPNLPSIPFVYLMVHHSSYSLSFYSTHQPLSHPSSESLVCVSRLAFRKMRATIQANYYSNSRIPQEDEAEA